MKAWLERLKESRSGTAAIEFAIIAPVLFFMVFGVIESSIYFFKRSTLRYVAFESMRHIQTGKVQKEVDPEQAFEDVYCHYTPMFMDCTKIQFDVRSYNDLASATFTPPTFDGDGIATNFAFEPGYQEQVTTVTAVMQYRFVTPYIQKIFQPSGNPVIVIGFAIARNEPFGCIDEC